MKAHVHRPVVNQAEERVCRRCGIVLEQAPLVAIAPVRSAGSDELPYQKYFDLREDWSRHDQGFGTDLFQTFRRTEPMWRERWRRIHRLVTPKTRERRFRDISIDIQKVCERLGLPRSVRRELCQVARKPRPGFSRSRLLAYLTYIVCRVRGIPRSLNEIETAFEDIHGKRVIGKRPIKKIHELARELNYELPKAAPWDYLNRFASKLGVSVTSAAEILNQLPRKLVVSQNPRYVAATVLKLSSGYKLPVVSEKLGLAISTLYRYCQLIGTHIGKRNTPRGRLRSLSSHTHRRMPDRCEPAGPPRRRYAKIRPGGSKRGERGW